MTRSCFRFLSSALDSGEPAPASAGVPAFVAKSSCTLPPSTTLSGGGGKGGTLTLTLVLLRFGRFTAFHLRFISLQLRFGALRLLWGRVNTAGRTGPLVGRAALLPVLLHAGGR